MALLLFEPLLSPLNWSAQKSVGHLLNILEHIGLLEERSWFVNYILAVWIEFGCKAWKSGGAGVLDHFGSLEYVSTSQNKHAPKIT